MGTLVLIRPTITVRSIDSVYGAKVLMHSFSGSRMGGFGMVIMVRNISCRCDDCRRNYNIYMIDNSVLLKRRPADTVGNCAAWLPSQCSWGTRPARTCSGPSSRRNSAPDLAERRLTLIYLEGWQSSPAGALDWDSIAPAISFLSSYRTLFSRYDRRRGASLPPTSFSWTIPQSKSTSGLSR